MMVVLFFTVLQSQAEVNFKFSAGTINESNIKTRMERNISSLLTEINRACDSGSDLVLDNVDMEEAAKDRFSDLWQQASHFSCDNEVNISKCLNDFQGYQVRSIPITMKPVNSSYHQSLNRELTISLNKKGVITGVRPSWESQEDFSTFMAGAQSVEDARMKLEIGKWVEDFRSYYNEKNLKALNQIYSDDALIITGSVVIQKKIHGESGFQLKPSIIYRSQSKQEYIRRLADIFKNSKELDVEFSDLEVAKHGARDNIYGVTVRQKWYNKKTNSRVYQDDGWLFLIWDFTDSEHPQIHVRTWQDEKYTQKSEVFNLDDFKIF